MAHRVASGAFRNPGLADGILELALHGRFVQVMTGDPSCARMRAEGGGCELVLIRRRPTAPHPSGSTSFRPKGLQAFGLFASTTLWLHWAICAAGLPACERRLRRPRGLGDVFLGDGPDAP